MNSSFRRFPHRSALSASSRPAAPVLLAALALLGACSSAGRETDGSQTDDSRPAWESYGGDAGGTRFSRAKTITTSNVASLVKAWEFRTDELKHSATSTPSGGQCAECHQAQVKLEVTPILADDKLLLSTPFNRVIALDPESGREIWRFDPALDFKLERNEGFVSRGVAYWRDDARTDAGSGSNPPCARRVLFGTVDARLLALDAADGKPCAAFGDSGTVRLDQGIGYVQTGQYGVTSPPVVVDDIVVVGSSMGDNRRVDLESGVVRAYDVRTGRLMWTWDPIPRRRDDAAASTWPDSGAGITGGANAWAPLSVDPVRQLVFVPTGAPSTDYYGGHRLGDNSYANSVVALEAKTGRVRWHFQVVHHDLWDFDVASQPTLATIQKDGAPRDVVIAPTKMGHLFVLDRETGTPVFPVEERPVPASDVPGEVAARTQPFPVLPQPLHPGKAFGASEVWGLDKADSTFCRAQMEGMRSEGIFTPPSLRGTVMYPGFGGGMNWGGITYDPERNLIISNTLRLAMWVRLEPRKAATAGNQRGTPYTMSRAPLVSAKGLPCNPPPWGTLTAIDAATGLRRWDVPLGFVPKIAAVSGSERWGSPNFGGPITTAGGLTFIAATMDSHLRAIDTETGRELWKAALPAGGQATPMTYVWKGRQYVVIAAGGHSSLGTPLGDYLIAYALPEQNETANARR